uniref:Uncharacterized protein n=1 Tax=Amphimedon queenslandica TaxID=400682 RepID=A0A1X7TFM7_AMPQE
MATERHIARLLNEEIGPQNSDYIALVLEDYFCDETSKTDYKAVEDMAQEKEEGKRKKKRQKIVMKTLIHYCLILRWLWSYKYQILN